MEYNTRTYFKENEAEDVKGFTVIDTNEESGEYHIAEKWSRTSSAENDNSDKASSASENDKWLQYWIPESQLLSRVEAGKCVEAAELTDEQFEAVCEKIDHEKVAAPVEA